MSKSANGMQNAVDAVVEGDAIIDQQFTRIDDNLLGTILVRAAWRDLCWECRTPKMMLVCKRFADCLLQVDVMADALYAAEGDRICTRPERRERESPDAMPCAAC